MEDYTGPGQQREAVSLECCGGRQKVCRLCQRSLIRCPFCRTEWDSRGRPVRQTGRFGRRLSSSSSSNGRNGDASSSQTGSGVSFWLRNPHVSYLALSGLRAAFQLGRQAVAGIGRARGGLPSARGPAAIAIGVTAAAVAGGVFVHRAVKDSGKRQMRHVSRLAVAVGRRPLWVAGRHPAEILRLLEQCVLWQASWVSFLGSPVEFGSSRRNLQSQIREACVEVPMKQALSYLRRFADAQSQHPLRGRTVAPMKGRSSVQGGGEGRAPEEARLLPGDGGASALLSLSQRAASAAAAVSSWASRERGEGGLLAEPSAPPLSRLVRAEGGERGRTGERDADSAEGMPPPLPLRLEWERAKLAVGQVAFLFFLWLDTVMHTSLFVSNRFYGNVWYDRLREDFLRVAAALSRDDFLFGDLWKKAGGDRGETGGARPSPSLSGGSETAAVSSCEQSPFLYDLDVRGAEKERQETRVIRAAAAQWLGALGVVLSWRPSPLQPNSGDCLCPEALGEHRSWGSFARALRQKLEGSGDVSGVIRPVPVLPEEGTLSGRTSLRSSPGQIERQRERGRGQVQGVEVGEGPLNPQKAQTQEEGGDKKKDKQERRFFRRRTPPQVDSSTPVVLSSHATASAAVTADAAAGGRSASISSSCSSSGRLVERGTGGGGGSRGRGGLELDPSLSFELVDPPDAADTVENPPGGRGAGIRSWGWPFWGRSPVAPPPYSPDNLHHSASSTAQRQPDAVGLASSSVSDGGPSTSTGQVHPAAAAYAAVPPVLSGVPSFSDEDNGWMQAGSTSAEIGDGVFVFGNNERGENCFTRFFIRRLRGDVVSEAGAAASARQPVMGGEGDLPVASSGAPGSLLSLSPPPSVSTRQSPPPSRAQREVEGASVSSGGAPPVVVPLPFVSIWQRRGSTPFEQPIRLSVVERQGPSFASSSSSSSALASAASSSEILRRQREEGGGGEGEGGGEEELQGDTAAEREQFRVEFYELPLEVARQPRRRHGDVELGPSSVSVPGGTFYSSSASSTSIHRVRQPRARWQSSPNASMRPGEFGGEWSGEDEEEADSEFTSSSPSSSRSPSAREPEDFCVREVDAAVEALEEGVISRLLEGRLAVLSPSERRGATGLGPRVSFLDGKRDAVLTAGEGPLNLYPLSPRSAFVVKVYPVGTPRGRLLSLGFSGSGGGGGGAGGFGDPLGASPCYSLVLKRGVQYELPSPSLFSGGGDSEEDRERRGEGMQGEVGSSEARAASSAAWAGKREWRGGVACGPALPWHGLTSVEIEAMERDFDENSFGERQERQREQSAAGAGLGVEWDEVLESFERTEWGYGGHCMSGGRAGGDGTSSERGVESESDGMGDRLEARSAVREQMDTRRNENGDAESDANSLFLR
uniref:Uncharacterized protein n=1 Tax=Chromera velia CCMP2878 TaxID=1169474 RepID=A0A0G4G7D4_9ALVE|eukprot:Cvel_20620.t1-p1 / transcript=Cvel_20620.t1 / gene=Cvel_20620 / organism=Chromera_velia_CCMP2878 / gene_product=hypothetical protein / transcript_product=hypothetical protein / location=Cvel_scaffold1867:12707-22575(+) / protein_length=1382 / sequence_SO=supercontig / SO=protein_coding / is_pseudo=false